MPSSPALPSALFATMNTGVVPARSQRPISSSRAVTPSRASMRKRAASASRTAASVCWRIRPGSEWGSSSSNPAVSITRNSSPSRLAFPSRRSRVTPGRSSTSARRLPTSRLNSVDLPTLGRPTMAIVGTGIAGSIAARQGCREALPECTQPTAIIEDVHRRVRDNWRQADRSAEILLALKSACRSVDIDERAVRTRDDQPPTRQNRPGIVNFALLRLGFDELRQLGDPADMTVLPVDAHELRLVGEDENPVTGDPRGIDSGDIELPLALTADEVERDHAAALSDGDHLAAVNDRVGINVIKR